jgi:hypothetical protein
VPGRLAVPNTSIVAMASPAGRKIPVAYPGGAAKLSPKPPVTTYPAARYVDKRVIRNHLLVAARSPISTSDSALTDACLFRPSYLVTWTQAFVFVPRQRATRATIPGKYIIKPLLDSVGFAEISTVALTDKLLRRADNVVCGVNRTVTGLNSSTARPGCSPSFRSHQVPLRRVPPFPCAPAKVR